MKWSELEPPILDALANAGRVFGMFGLPCIVTSLNDSRHREGSFHYRGRAADLRAHHVPEVEREQVLITLRNALGHRYDVLLEARGTPNEHYHVEFDPKG